MADYLVYAFCTQIGTLHLEADGLYDILTAELPGMAKLLRLYLVTNQKTLLLGTPLPVSGGMRCTRRLARRQLQQQPLCAVACSSDWVQWQPEGENLWRTTQQWVELAIPARDPDAPVEDYLWLRLEIIDGQVYWVRQWPLPVFYGAQRQHIAASIWK